MVRSGEIVTVDGATDSEALIDYSSLTGESLPVKREKGEDILSGGSNVGRAFSVTASRSAAESTVAGIVASSRSGTSVEGADDAACRPYAIIFLFFTRVRKPCLVRGRQ